MNFNERIRAYIAQANISKAYFEKQCGMSNGYINSVKGIPSEEKFRAILSAFPDLNPVWLLTGEGEMLRLGVRISADNNKNSTINQNNFTSNTDESKIKIYEERIRHLEAIIAEKERLIQILLERK